MLKKILYADLLKMKGSSVIPAHILIPVITSGLFLLYYSFSVWDEYTKIIAFYQTMGAGLPALIGIFTAVIIEQEQNAGACQNLLTLPKKTLAFLSKLLLLLMLGLFAILLTTVLFGVGFKIVTGTDAVSMAVCLKAAWILWYSSIPLYLWQMILAFRFGKGVSIGAGIISGLVNALMLTNLGVFIWKYVPASWTGRIPYTYWQSRFSEAGAADRLRAVIPIYYIFTVISMVYYLLWSSRWEGNKISE